MRLSFMEVAKHLTGISTPVFGVSWAPPVPDVDVARRLLTFLEDRRVLYNPYNLESPSEAIGSVLKIRERLTAELGELDRSSPLAQSIAAMRAACRKFLDQAQSGDSHYPMHHYAMHHRFGIPCDIAPLFSAIGELRSLFGIHVALISAKYRIDIEEELATILPALPDDCSPLAG